MRITAICLLLVNLLSGPYSFAQEDRITLGGETEEKSKDPEGPTNLAFEYLNQIQADHSFESNRGIINLSRSIYRDANPRSGYFYYLPESYSLNWDETSFEYDIEFTQGMASQEATKVVVTARLKPNITRKDLDIARKLLELDVQSNPVASEYSVNRLVWPCLSRSMFLFLERRTMELIPKTSLFRRPKISWILSRSLFRWISPIS